MYIPSWRTQQILRLEHVPGEGEQPPQLPKRLSWPARLSELEPESLQPCSPACSAAVQLAQVDDVGRCLLISSRLSPLASDGHVMSMPSCGQRRDLGLPERARTRSGPAGLNRSLLSLLSGYIETLSTPEVITIKTRNQGGGQGSNSQNPYTRIFHL